MLVAALAGPVRAQSSAPREPDFVTLFVLGNVEFLLLHEVAHLLIDEKDIPVIGPEENAADYIATLALLREQPFDPRQPDRGRKYLVAAADAFSAAWITGADLGAEVPYWDDHALSIQRYYQIVCLLYGSNPNAFATVPKSAGLPLTRAQSCAAEYARAERAIGWLLEHYGRQPSDPWPMPPKIVYEAPPSQVSARLLEQVQSQRLLELTLERLNERFSLRDPFTVVTRACGRPQAAWLSDQRELVVCYELLDTLYLLGIQAKARSLQSEISRH